MKESVAAMTRSHEGDRNVNLILVVLLLQADKGLANSSSKLTRCFQVRCFRGQLLIPNGDHQAISAATTTVLQFQGHQAQLSELYCKVQSCNGMRVHRSMVFMAICVLPYDRPAHHSKLYKYNEHCPDIGLPYRHPSGLS